MERLKKGKTRIKMLTSNFPQIASRPGAHNLRCLFRVTFVPKVSKDIFNELKHSLEFNISNMFSILFVPLTHCPGCIWAATDRLRSIWVPVRTMLQRCGPGEHHHLIFTWSSSPITWSPSPSLYSSGEICTRVEVRDRLEAGGLAHPPARGLQRAQLWKQGDPQDWHRIHRHHHYFHQRQHHHHHGHHHHDYHHHHHHHHPQIVHLTMARPRSQSKLWRKNVGWSDLSLQGG